MEKKNGTGIEQKNSISIFENSAQNNTYHNEAPGKKPHKLKAEY